MSGGEALREPWRSLRRQREAASFGMWLFLGSEAMLFGGLMLAFVATRFFHPEAFAAAGRAADLLYGTINTLLLLTSSLTAAIGAQAARAELRRLAFWGFGLTMALGLCFMAIKGLEWHEDLQKGLLPGPAFALQPPSAQLAFGFYWLLTALHALHLCGGVGTIGWLLRQAARGERPLRSPAFEAAALYWHLIDVVWVFLYPLLYLDGRSAS